MVVTTSENELMNIVWKDTLIDPSKNLTNLSQFTGSYATTTINKATEVRMLLKEKEQKSLLLEDQLAQEKTNQQVEL